MANIIVRVAGVSSATLATETEGAGLPASLRRTNGPASSQSMESTGSRGSTAFAKAVMNFATPLPAFLKPVLNPRIESLWAVGVANVGGSIAPEGILSDVRSMIPNPLKRSSNKDEVQVARYKLRIHDRPLNELFAEITD